MTERHELAAWLRLLLAPGVGRDTARQLLARHGSPEAAYEGGALTQPPEFEQQLSATCAWLDGGADRRVIPLGDPAYPQPLLHTADPPLLLFAQGCTELLQARCIAIVGSRNPTGQGADNARAFASHLSRAGFTIVSGLALGVDGAAHEGGLSGAGSTIAVVGTGLDRVYPGRHRPLAHRIAEQGLLVGEFPLGTHPLRQNFPLRNRIIAGLSAGTLVVEATLHSGSLITARMAAEAGREVFAIPGSIHSPQSRGCHALIKQGAKLVETAQDVLDELEPWRAGSASSAPSGDTAAVDPVLQALGHDPATLDALIARTGWPAAGLNARLLELELEGLVVRLPGGMFQRRSPV